MITLDSMPEMVAQMKREGIDLISSPGSGLWFATCPLCKAPGLTMAVYEKRQVFECSHCKRGGKLHTFIRYFKGMTKDTVMVYLARQRAIDLDKERQEARKRALLDTEVI